MAFKNYYKVLGIKDFSSGPEIKKAYRSLAFRYHPDHNQGGSHGNTLFLDIKEAYEVLSSPQKRKNYDIQLRAATFYAPAYSFGKHHVQQTKEDQPGYEIKTKEVEKGTSMPAYLKPVILIVITLSLMYIIIHPPVWIQKFVEPDKTIYPDKTDKK